MQTQPGLEFKHVSFPTYLMSYETMLEKTREAAEACRTLYSLLLESDSETTVHSVGQSTDGEKRKRHRRHLDDGSRLLQETVYTVIDRRKSV